jgi:histidine decarboxylase
MVQIEGRQENQNVDLVEDGLEIPAQHVGDKQSPPEPNPQDFQLEGKELENRVSVLNKLGESLVYRRDHFLGYQANQGMDSYQSDLRQFLDMALNNIGDPFSPGGYRVESRVAECAVLAYFAKLWHGTPYTRENPSDPKSLPDPESCWGYGLSMGSTEGNLYALWNARDYLAGKLLNVEPDLVKTRPVNYDDPKPVATNPNAYQPVVFYSEDTHYSLTKAVRVLGLTTFSQLGRDKYPHACPISPGWPDEVPSELPLKIDGDNQYSTFGPGSIDVAKLATLVEFFAKEGHPIIVNLNYGTTFKGAYDNVKKVCDTLLPIFEERGLVSRDVEYKDGKFDTRRGFWIHVDGALGAGYMPFLAKAGISIPEFDFGLRSPLSKNLDSVDMVSSIVTSGHKWLGCPWPCGVLLTKVKYQMQPPDKAEYIGAPDTTFAGSRNGFSPIVLWYRIAQSSDEDRAKVSLAAQELAKTVAKRLKDEVQKKWNFDLYVDRSPQAITVRFRTPNKDLVRKWSLSTVSMYMRPDKKTEEEKERRDYAHVFLMEFTTKNPSMVDEFIKDLLADGAFSESAYEPGDALVASFPFADRGFA